MAVQGPILIIEDDEDDQFLLQSLLEELNVPNTLRFFFNGKTALDYLLTTTEQPFLIFCDINMPIMNGLELHGYISENAFLRKKAIPFVFLTTAANKPLIDEAYGQLIQGFYQKPTSMKIFKRQLETILEYWSSCLHPNNYKS